MAKSEASLLARKVLELALVIWASLVFQGLLVGSSLLFLRHLFSPALLENYSHTINTEISDWLYLAFGVALVVAWSAFRGKPLLRDSNREQLESIEYILKRLPPSERVQVYRILASKILDQFEIDRGLTLDFRREVEEQLKEKTNS